MNRLLLIVCLCFFWGYYCFAQQQKTYLLLAPEPEYTGYKINQFLLRSNELYKSDYRIEVYNVIFPKEHNRNELLILFSLLPDLQTGDIWKELGDSAQIGNLKNIADLPYQFMPALGYGNKQSDLRRKFFQEYILIKEENGKYYASINCLMEVFEIKQNSAVFPPFYGQLGLEQDALSIKEFVSLYPTMYPDFPDIPLQFYGKEVGVNYIDGWRTWKEFLSKKMKIKDKVAYQFWTCASSNVADAYDISRGIDRFIYIPDVGIVGGSYDFFFYQLPMKLRESIDKVPNPNNLTSEEWNNNVMEEKVMIAEEIK